MEATGLLIATGLWALLQVPPDLPLPPLPEDAPSLVEVEGLYRAMVEALRAGDRPALLRLIYSTRRQLLPSALTPLPPEEARQYTYCHIQRPVLGDGEKEIVYLLVCEAAGERVEEFFRLRRDQDGVWRILP